MAVFGPFSAVFRTIVLKVQDDRRYAKQVFPMRAMLFHGDWAIKGGKWVFNKACTTPWCQAVVHFEVTMSRYSAVSQHNPRDRGGTSLKQALFLQR